MFASSQLYASYRKDPTEIISTFDKALAESDFMNLFGKLLFLPLSVGSSISRRVDGGYSMDVM